MVLIIAIAVILSAISLFFSTNLIRDIIDRQYKTRANDLAATVAVTIDSGYASALQRAVSDIYDSVDDKVGSDACPIGCIDPVYDFNMYVFEDPEAGFPAYITDTEEYGWLVTAGAPVHDITGKVVCYAAVDISMEEMRSAQLQFTLLAIMVQAAVTLIICIIGILLVNHFMVNPINMLSAASDKYCNEHTDEYRHVFAPIDVHTGDELEILADSMKEMERDMNQHIANITAAMEELRLTKEEARNGQSGCAHRDTE